MSSDKKTYLVRARCLVEFAVQADDIENVPAVTDNYDCTVLGALPASILEVDDVVEVEEQ
ncbi:hypothetical protein HPC38_07730 [Pasteurellaceae bacterium HPA106]|uniref:hypothetical protein n=1 Tax=Spirabiliibacterium pneumoniae TaxID=221400 RepID=UPI001AADDCC6|nr:hypothetical protein [Spirabiliibacterium pneumoniae]MBE2896761.1 hypothetical protein [Spirabiliibacterium pneumoniae]